MVKNDDFQRLVLVNFLRLEKGNFLKLIVGKHGEKWLGRLSRKPLPVQKREPKTNHLHKKQKMKTVPLDVAPERRTKRCSPRFRPGGCFWNQGSDTCRKAVRERSVGP